MIAFPTLLIVCGLLLAGDRPIPYDAGYLCQPAYSIDEVYRGPTTRYVPQPGDIYLATDRSRIIQGGHRLALSGAPHHSGIVFALHDGSPAILESGPFNSLRVEILDLRHDLQKHEDRTEKVWIRQRRTPMTKEQCAIFTDWAVAQDGKPFAARRMLRQMTPFRTRGPLRTFVMGAPNGQRDRYFCAELVLEACVAMNLLAPETTRPSATYPRDLFHDRSSNVFLDRYFTLADGWHPPARWTSTPR